jgi:hypothetical protein
MEMYETRLFSVRFSWTRHLAMLQANFIPFKSIFGQKKDRISQDLF